MSGLLNNDDPAQINIPTRKVIPVSHLTSVGQENHYYDNELVVHIGEWQGTVRNTVPGL